MSSPSSTPPFVSRALATAPRRLAAATAVVAVGLLSSIAGFFALRSAEQARVQAEFERHAQDAARAAVDGLIRHADALYALRNLFHFSAQVSRHEFAGAARELIARRPGMRALEWAPLVTAPERAAFEARMRAEGFPAYGIHTRRADGTLGPAAERADYFPVAYIEPLAGNEPAMGFDLPSGRTWPKLAEAIDTGGLSTSIRIPLMTPAARAEHGYLLQLPVYSPGPEPPADAAARRARLRGFVLGVFNLADTVAALFPPEEGNVVEILFTDRSAPPENRFLHYIGAGGGIDDAARAPGSEAFAAGLHLRHTLTHGDRTWELWIRPRARWLEARPAGQSWLALGLGLALTGLVGSAMFGAIRREGTVARLVHERTAELRAAQAALEEDVRQRRETERQLSALIAQLPGVAIRCAADQNLTAYFVSEGMAKLSGYPAAEFLAGRRHLGELSVPEDRPAARAALAAAIGHRSPFEIGYRIRHCAGEVRHVLVRGHPVFADDGSLRFLEGLAIDVTALKAAELEHIAFERRLLEMQKLESLGVLAGGIAHDFNNLLTAMLGNASLARHLLPPGAPGQEQLSHIEQAARRAADLCQQMLAYAGKKEVRAQPVDLSALVRTNASLLRVTIRKNTQLDLRLDDTLPHVLADAAQLQQIVMNLVINAAEAVGDEPGTVTITTFRRACDAALLRTALHRPELPAGDYVGLEVCDTGCGMAPETVARIFEPFFTTKFAGRGLGLAAVLGIVQTHGGALWVESAPGRGSTFRLLLRAQREPVAALAPPAAAAQGPAGALSGRVLVVDDEEPVRIVLGAVLSRHGLSPVLAASGNEALQRLGAGGGDFRLVLLDLTMPGLSGEQTLQAMRRTHPQLRVILMSGFSERETRERCQALGAADFVAKPFDVQVLLEKMRRALA